MRALVSIPRSIPRSQANAPAREPEARAHLVDLVRERDRVGGVAGVDLDCHRAPPGVAQPPVDDLQLALLPVARVAETMRWPR